jgi:hypothetical protein
VIVFRVFTCWSDPEVRRQCIAITGPPCEQQDALTNAGCGRVYTDVASGALDDRDGLAEALDCVRAGDTLVVRRLDRLGRSLKQLIERVTALEVRGVGFRSLTEAMDTTTSGGRLIFHVFGALAEFERAVIRDRTLVVLRQPPIPAEPREGALGWPQATIHRLGITTKRWRSGRRTTRSSTPTRAAHQSRSGAPAYAASA